MRYNVFDFVHRTFVMESDIPKICEKPQTKKPGKSAKQPKTPKNYISARSGTLRYELSKSLAPKERILPENELKLRSDILELDGICEYCRKNEAAGKGDHFNCMVVNKQPSDYCNDLWNLVPCCTTCNSSKSGTHWKKWMTSKENTKKTKENKLLSILSKEEADNLVEKFSRYDKIMNIHCQKRSQSDKILFDRIMANIEKTLDDAQIEVIEYVRLRDTTAKEDTILIAEDEKVEKNLVADNLSSSMSELNLYATPLNALPQEKPLLKKDQDQDFKRIPKLEYHLKK